MVNFAIFTNFEVLAYSELLLVELETSHTYQTRLELKSSQKSRWSDVKCARDACSKFAREKSVILRFCPFFSNLSHFDGYFRYNTNSNNCATTSHCQKRLPTDKSAFPCDFRRGQIATLGFCAWYIYIGDRRFFWKSATSSPPELKEIETCQTTHFEDNCLNCGLGGVRIKSGHFQTVLWRS